MVDIVSTGIETSSGKTFDFANIRAEDIRIQDIARSLAKQCRYTGHCNQFYSVAEHCIKLAVWLYNECGDEEVALHMLLHDASEAYVGDVSSPLKRLIPEYKAIENEIHEVICFKFGLQHPFPDWVKELDLRILLNEKEALFPNSRYKWGVEHLNYERLNGVEIQCMNPETAAIAYLGLYNQLTNQECTF